MNANLPLSFSLSLCEQDNTYGNPIGESPGDFPSAQHIHITLERKLSAKMLIRLKTFVVKFPATDSLSLFLHIPLLSATLFPLSLSPLSFLSLSLIQPVKQSFSCAWHKLRLATSRRGALHIFPLAPLPSLSLSLCHTLHLPLHSSHCYAAHAN